MNLKEYGETSRFSHDTLSLPKIARISKYICISNLGSGRFGAVYKGHHETTGQFVAIKVESMESSIPTIKHETIMLNYLHSKFCKYIPKIHWFGRFEEKVCLVMSYYDCSLYEYIMNYSGIVAPDTDYLLQEVLYALQSIHNSGVVHRDIKPQNIMLSGNKVVLIDFGMATFYIDETCEPIPESDIPKEHVCGTLSYISYFVHLGKSYSRRDDMISTAYLYMWMNGCLFWNNRSFNRDEIPCENETYILHPKNQHIKEQKELSFIKTQVKDSRIIEFIEYVYGISYEATPSYVWVLKDGLL